MDLPIPPPLRSQPITSRRRVLLWCGVGLAAFGAFLIVWISLRQKAEGLRRLIEGAARKHGLPSALVEAVVYAESKGDAHAVSPAQAYGLMQLRIPTAREMARRDITVDDLFDPRTNLDLGCRYLRRMIDRYDGDVKLALMAYNAGPSNVDSWLSEEPDPDRILETRAFGQTRHYVKAVLDRVR